MSSPAVALLRKLTREEAVDIINQFKILVTTSNIALKVNSIIVAPFEVHDGARHYTFAPQPFRVLRAITKYEYTQALPESIRSHHLHHSVKYFYEILTD